MNSAERAYRMRNKYGVWVYRKDGTKFKGYFRDKQDARAWASKMGKAASLSKPRKQVRKQRDMFGFPSFRF